MNLSVFGIVVSVLLLLQIVMIVLNLEFIETVKAGDKDDYHFRYNLSGVKIGTVLLDGKIRDVSGFVRLKVRGDSMKDYNIFDGQTVFVESCGKDNVAELTKYPILVYNLKSDYCDSRKKLRKFVGCVNSNDAAEEVFKRFQDRIDIGPSIFISEYNERMDDLKKRDNFEQKNYILSTTYSEKLKRRHYSLHSLDSVCGIVRYVL